MASPPRRSSPVFHAWSPEVRRIDVAPSILSADFAAMGRDLARCRRADARWIHVDVMDGHFVPNLTFGPPLVRSWRAAEPALFLDAHLMVENPMDFARAFREAGADSITIHAETTKDARRDLRAIRRLGAGAGISIKPRTPVKAIRDCLDSADIVLVMTVEPGFGGQALIPSTLNKVRELDLLRRSEGHRFRLQVDGGINRSTIAMALAAGADSLVAGSAVFGEGRTVAENLALLRACIDECAGPADAKDAKAPKPEAPARRAPRKPSVARAS